MPKVKRFLIFSGGNLDKWALDEIKEGDFLIGADRGALFLLENNLRPDFAIGDFDSLTSREFQFVSQRCKDLVSCDPVRKDYTDTEMAFNQALLQNPSEIVLLGATGTRFDHTLANVHLLYKGLQQGVSCRIIDENNEITLIDSFTQITKGRYTHVSLLPLSMSVKGVTLEGFQYPLDRATLSIGSSLAISNILLPEAGSGCIFIESGALLVIKSKD